MLAACRVTKNKTIIRDRIVYVFVCMCVCVCVCLAVCMAQLQGDDSSL